MEFLQERRLEWEATPFSRGIFPTQGSNLGLLQCKADSLLSELPGKPKAHHNPVLNLEGFCELISKEQPVLKIKWSKLKINKLY